MTTADTTDTRERLLQAAADLMWERSFQATGVDELCQRANARKGSFYHYFPSKSELAVAAIEASWAQVRTQVFEPAFSGAGGGLAQLKSLGKRVLEFQKAVAADKGTVLGCPFGNLGQEMALQDEHIRVALQRIFEAHCDYFEGALLRAEQLGEIPPGNHRQRARSIFALLEGALMLSKVANDMRAFRDAVALLPVVAAA